LLVIVPKQLTLVEQLLQGRQPPKQLNSFDQLGNFIFDQLGFCEKIEIDRILQLKQTKRNFVRGFADADTGRMR
jgi:hypothetical protein